MSTDITTQNSGLSVFNDAHAFEQAQRMAAPLAQSSMIPNDYKNNLPNVLVAMEMAHRLNQSVLMVMQNTSIIHGKPGLDAKFIIALINASKRYAEPLDFDITGAGDTLACSAFTYKKDGVKISGPEVTMKMAISEGWTTKNGSKWKTMPELMIRYRAATFFSRIYCPDITMGMQTADEITDIGYTEEISNTAIEKINELVKQPVKETHDYEVVEPETVSSEPVHEVETPPAPEPLTPAVPELPSDDIF